MRVWCAVGDMDSQYCASSGTGPMHPIRQHRAAPTARVWRPRPYTRSVVRVSPGLSQQPVYPVGDYTASAEVVMPTTAHRHAFTIDAAHTYPPTAYHSIESVRMPAETLHSHVTASAEIAKHPARMYMRAPSRPPTHRPSKHVYNSALALHSGCRVSDGVRGGRGCALAVQCECDDGADATSSLAKPREDRTRRRTSDRSYHLLPPLRGVANSALKVARLGRVARDSLPRIQYSWLLSHFQDRWSTESLRSSSPAPEQGSGGVGTPFEWRATVIFNRPAGSERQSPQNHGRRSKQRTDGGEERWW
ncbi:hypothetical protein DFP72DRAFT_851969 [Ephemerocybe angulata]|uniref:Uncharacterized protein n=1 Tax=Ephemerocybe angulata TaxID=980116 RepID=A0A8H6HMY0_9AGAR|nr:hypothetical protein DFP72DRAFT_851969 [Tulosesus angulatus]